MKRVSVSQEGNKDDGAKITPRMLCIQSEEENIEKKRESFMKRSFHLIKNFSIACIYFMYPFLL
jgi:hypothetical protein